MNNYDIKCKIIEEELKTFWPQWHVVKHLGGGAFGDVFEVYRDNFGIRESSALKMIQISDAEETRALFSFAQEAGDLSKRGGQPDIPTTFRNEIQIMEALRGAPNIVTIEDFHLKRDASSTTLFVRMELLTSFQQVTAERQRKGTPFTIPEILKIGRDICTALMYCEGKGIIHRDIKPANLFIDSFGNYKVGDFGASKRLDTIHAAQTMTGIGTISYMAPEIFRGHSYNNTVDIYAVGLVLYQLLNNGRMPFLPEGDSYTTQDIDSANYRRLHGTPLPSLTGRSVGGKRIDSRLDAVVRRACAMDPADRYQSAKEFYDALALTETEEKKPVPVYAKRPQGSLAPDASLQNREQEGARTEIGTEPSDDPETVVSLKDLPQTRKHSGQKVRRSNSGKETRRSTSPHRDGSSHIWPQKEERRAGGNNKPVIVIVLLLIIAVAALVVVQSRGGSSGPSASTDSDAASQTEEHKQNVSEEDDTVDGSSSDTEAADTVSGEDKENVSEKDDTVDGSGSDTEAADTVSEEDKENVSGEDDTVDGSSSDTEAADTVSGEYDRAPGPISDSWEEIIAAGEDGTYIDKYQIGDTKGLDLGEEGVIEMELVAFDADELADGSGKAHMTWIAKDLLNTEHFMNEEFTNEGGWPASDMRAWLRDSILPLFPETVRSNIREVKKYSYSCSYNGTISSSDTIWIPSSREMFGVDNAYEDEGPEYLTAFPDHASRQKQHIGVSEPSVWWLRSASNFSVSFFCDVGSDGSVWNANIAYDDSGVVVGFCF